MKKISAIFFVVFMLVLISSCNGNNTNISPTSTNNLAPTQIALITNTPTTTSTPTQFPISTNSDKKFDFKIFIILFVISIILSIIFEQKIRFMLARRNKEKRRKEEWEKRRELEERRSREHDEMGKWQREESEWRKQREQEERYARERAEMQRRRLEEQPHRERAELERQRRELDGSQREESEWQKQPVRFHTLWNVYICPEVWQTMLVYIFSGHSGLMGARSDFSRRRTAPSEHYEDSSSMSRGQIRRGTQITVIPELNGFRFNPPTANVLFLEDWHCLEFRMQALPETNSKIGESITGHVSFYVGPILIGETNLFATIASPENIPPSSTTDYVHYSWEETSTIPYRAIFVSYSHKDSLIVDKLEIAYRALGDRYLRDIQVLRSGEKWNPALLSKIHEADIFQLCWSEAAKQSVYVEQEWRFALTLNRQNFIRPMFWKKPLPEPPEELNKIHFTYVDIEEKA